MTEEHLDLRDLVEDEVEYRKLDPSLVNKVLWAIKRSDRLMEMLDLVVDGAIAMAQKGD